MDENSNKDGCLMFFLFYLTLVICMFLAGLSTGDMKAGMVTAGGITVIAAVIGIMAIIAMNKEDKP